jgi:hypothetical protein
MVTDFSSFSREPSSGPVAGLSTKPPPTATRRHQRYDKGGDLKELLAQRCLAIVIVDRY